MFLLYFDQSKSCSFAHKLLIITITFNSTQSIQEITAEREREREKKREWEGVGWDEEIVCLKKSFV